MINLLDNPGIDIFGFRIYWYAIFMVLAILTAAVLSGVLMRRRNISTENLMLLFIICVPTAIVGARVFYCITDGYLQRGASFMEWINTRDGGMSIIGALIGGIGMGLIVCLVKKVNFFRMADCILPTIPLAQAIGRWGNFVNQEVYGRLVTNEALQFFPFAVYIDKLGEWHYALFFYEGLINLCIFAVLFTLAWRNGKKPDGILTGAMIMGYGIVRSIMEPLRDPKFILSGASGDNAYSQLFAIGGILLGAGIIIAVLAYNKYKNGKLIGSATGDPYTVGEFVKCYKEDKPIYDKWNLASELYPERKIEYEKQKAEQRAAKEEENRKKE